MVAVVIELDPLGPLEADSDGKFSKIFGTTLSSSNSVTMSQSESDERNRNVHTVPIASH